MNSFQQFYIQSYKNIFVGASILQKKVFFVQAFCKIGADFTTFR
jgi:hypothetical protein